MGGIGVVQSGHVRHEPVITREQLASHITAMQIQSLPITPSGVTLRQNVGCSQKPKLIETIDVGHSTRLRWKITPATLDRLQCVSALCDPVTLTFDLSTPKLYNLQDIPRSFHVPSLNTLGRLGSFLFELYCWPTDRQTHRRRWTPYSRDSRRPIVISVAI